MDITITNYSIIMVITITNQHGQNTMVSLVSPLGWPPSDLKRWPEKVTSQQPRSRAPRVLLPKRSSTSLASGWLQRTWCPDASKGSPSGRPSPWGKAYMAMDLRVVDHWYRSFVYFRMAIFNCSVWLPKGAAWIAVYQSTIFPTKHCNGCSYCNGCSSGPNKTYPT